MNTNILLLIAPETDVVWLYVVLAVCVIGAVYVWLMIAGYLPLSTARAEVEEALVMRLEALITVYGSEPEQDKVDYYTGLYECALSRYEFYGCKLTPRIQALQAELEHVRKTYTPAKV